MSWVVGNGGEPGIRVSPVTPWVLVWVIIIARIKENFSVRSFRVWLVSNAFLFVV